MNGLRYIVLLSGICFLLAQDPPEEFQFNQSASQAFYFIESVTINNSNIASEDWVGAFNGDVCVGAWQWNVPACNGTCHVPVMGYDSSTENMAILTEGYCEIGDIPTFKIFDTSSNEYYDAIASEEYEWQDGIFPMINSLVAFVAIPGCTDSDACNYDAIATEDDGSCLANDCTGECGGSAVEDECGVCDGPGAIYECGCFDMPDGDCNCNGNVEDECGICGGLGALYEHGCYPVNDLFISEYIEGSNIFNKAIEIYNGTGSDVALNTYEIWKISNGGDWVDYTLGLSGTLMAGSIYVVCRTDAIPEILEVCDLTDNDIDWNGNDAIGLSREGLLIDAVGESGDAPGGGWDVAGEDRATRNHTLVRKFSVQSNIEGNAYTVGGNLNWHVSAGNTADNSEWIVFEQDDFSHLGSHEDNLSLLHDRLQPDTYSISNIYPNPFNPITNIEYSLPNNASFELNVYNIQGRQIQALVQGFQMVGYHSISWDASSYPSGIYFIRLESDKYIETQRIVLIK